MNSRQSEQTTLTIHSLPSLIAHWRVVGNAVNPVHFRIYLRARLNAGNYNRNLPRLRQVTT